MKGKIRLTLWLCWLTAATAVGQKLAVVGRMDVAPVWSGCPVGFAMLVSGGQHYLAYYSAGRVMTLAQRALDADAWRFVELPSRLGWDSHNEVAMAVDADGYLHVAGNMHAVPLVYFRSDKPGDIGTMQALHTMTGEREQRVTYPQFMRGADGALLFTYRDGHSGNGVQIWNRYDLATRQWRRLLDVPLFDGEGKMNAYPQLPVLGKDGYYHLAWVWRDTPDCATCHDISYVRSRDLIHWENAAGHPVALPIRCGADVVVDPVPVRGGLINCCQALGFDTQGRVIVSYTKHDSAGNTQLMNARLEGGAWKHYQTSSWTYRWAFSGGGTIVAEIGVGRVEVQDGQLAQSYSHKQLGNGRWLLDGQRLQPAGKIGARVGWPRELGQREHEMKEMQVRRVSDWAAEPETGRSEDGFFYRAVWESLPANRDRPQSGGVPPPSQLRVFKMDAADLAAGKR